jgi:hypothetical protein
MMIGIFLALALLSVFPQVVASAETRSSAQIARVSRQGDETVYLVFVKSEKGDFWRRIRATKAGSPCEGFFGGDEIAAVYDVDIIILTTGSKTCRLDIEEISQGGDAAAGTMRGRPRREPRRRCLLGAACVRPASYSARRLLKMVPTGTSGMSANAIHPYLVKRTTPRVGSRSAARRLALNSALT